MIIVVVFLVIIITDLFLITISNNKVPFFKVKMIETDLEIIINFKIIISQKEIITIKEVFLETILAIKISPIIIRDFLIDKTIKIIVVFSTITTKVIVKDFLVINNKMIVFLIHKTIETLFFKITTTDFLDNRIIMVFLATKITIKVSSITIIIIMAFLVLKIVFSITQIITKASLTIKIIISFLVSRDTIIIVFLTIIISKIRIMHKDSFGHKISNSKFLLTINQIHNFKYHY